MIVSTIASHSSLQIVQGAKKEGFKTRLYVSPKRKNFYSSLPIIDELIVTPDMKAILDDDGIIVPHGSFVAYLGIEAIEKSKGKFFGNKRFLKWETKFNLVDKALKKAKIPQVEAVDLSEVREDDLYFVRIEGPKGGSDHFIAYGRELEKRLSEVKEPYRIERFIDGVFVYVHFFCSPILERLELFGVDERLVIADANKRRPFEPLPYTILGNKSIALRESLLPELYDYGLAFVESMKDLEPPGVIGPFALHFAYDGEFRCIGFASRIDGGSNAKHWYSSLYWGEEVMMGQRIAKELCLALDEGRLEEVIT
ncbi:5-formaminoimidazole-4-carboxamide-1-(beta)-D-ribofuranosyl 5'-monophosphate synthetase [Thermococcus litoralis DSM 5473]|uniref:5-formaminoimidazole-4-carboxamide-1-(Beta)-D-ribofuranosyl 5'-monophosphate synthetase n=1 Tax=Thermococcus litoralis (strain ATCC 51850 / DSM 5473 / JCM 8560 / NS-C) TaxID=523849 RepID=H3ZM83_THELN|nr:MULTISPECIES: formate--phosphoribosylaminoimidazolecarboxamide ligase [Thermococcus]EHR78931.1 5-formaminoimidazole-4-carboxamide-1-(beta)-D-ribofuranosyl 5'-monophosphate synthetase [Thermococcus litoralis DSM 5473]